jgi:histidine triad (HIT) family protein
MSECLFCKIICGEIPSKKVYENEKVFAFHDINPAAPIHILIIPKVHIETINDLTPKTANLVGEMSLTAKKIAKDLEIDEKGYRLVFNCNKDAGQNIYHIHMHLLGGRKFGWPPG